MQPSVLLLDPVWNLILVRWMDLRTITFCEMDVEERERQPSGPIPKTMMVRFFPFRRENSALSNPQTQSMMLVSQRQLVKCYLRD